jgi:hypothetical protein
MTNKLVIAGGALAVVGVAVVGARTVTDREPSSPHTRPTKESFCSVTTQTNGSRLIELVRTGKLGGEASRNWILDGATSMATPAIRPDMTTLRDGIKAQPTNPSAETFAAAARVDAYILKTCAPTTPDSP